ncbi:hypothetical protein ACTPOK_12150 [Streptomyces inhibens]|uniref:hypothetical protein n=1 Tax=Streptomyces inhibens TaxID=2293571 RepID=UPI00402AC2FD
MRISRSAGFVLLTGALVGALSGCGSGGAAGNGAPEGGANGASGVSLRSKVKAPAAFDSAKGWEVKADWVPDRQPFPYAVSATSGKVAYLDKTPRGYVLKVREASSGKLLSASKPWKAPDLTKEQRSGKDGKLTVPRVVLISGGDREYFAIWAHGEKRKDQLHDPKEVISAAFYPADASGEDVAPSGSGDVEMSVTGSLNLNVFPGAGGLLVSTYGNADLVAPDGKLTKGIAKVKLGGQSADLDDAMTVPGPNGLVSNGDREGESAEGGGFGVDGGWHSKQVAPPGVDAVLEEDDVVNGSSKKPNGRVVGAAGSHLIGTWVTHDHKDVSSAVHDLRTGKVEATASCDTAATTYHVTAPRPVGKEETAPALSPNGNYLVKGGNIFDLKAGKGFCTDNGEDAKDIVLTAVGDDGTAYGLAGDASGHTPRIPVSVPATTGVAKPLPGTTEIPYAIAGGAGVFLTYAGQETVHMVVLSSRS